MPLQVSVFKPIFTSDQYALCFSPQASRAACEFVKSSYHRSVVGRSWHLWVGNSFTLPVLHRLDMTTSSFRQLLLGPSEYSSEQFQLLCRSYGYDLMYHHISRPFLPILITIGSGRKFLRRQRLLPPVLGRFTSRQLKPNLTCGR